MAFNEPARHEVLEAILDFNTTITGSSSIEEIFRHVGTLVRSILPFRIASAYRFDPLSMAMERCASDSPDADDLLPSFRRFPYAGSHAEAAVLHGGPALVTVAPPMFSPESVEALRRLAVNTVLVMPLFTGGQLIGSFHIGREENTPLSPDEERLLSRIATQVALALRTASHIAMLQRRQEQQERLIAITNALVAEVEPSRLFDTIAVHLRALYPVRSFGIIFYNPGTDTFERGTLLTAQGTMQSVEPIPRKGTQLEAVCARGQAAVFSPEQLESTLARFMSLHDTSAGERACAVVLPMYDRAKRILAVAGAVIDGSRPLTDEDIVFLNHLAPQIGLAVENMQAYREIRQLRLRLEQEGKYLKEEINDSFNVSGLIYASAAVANVMRAVEKAAATDATVLLLGETGTGKELFARTIHAMSTRADRPLVKVNCGAIPAGLIESHLFGHERGAFTGAVNQHIGVFEIADEGTLFLDEIADLPLDMQVKLLRVLQSGEVIRVGGHEPIFVRVRVIAATNRAIERMVDEGSFRADLYYRVAVIPIVIPPLRERPEDIPLLATAFANKYSDRFRKNLRRFAPQAMERLRAYRFPGNVRELENMIERAVVLCDDAAIGPEFFHFPSRPQELTDAGAAAEKSEREDILQALKECNWIVEGERGAAAKLRLKPSTLRSRMARMGIRRGSI